jgi:hypothetical protein
MKLGRLFKVMVAVLALGILTSNAQASVIYASGDAPKHATAKHHKHHKHHKIAKHHYKHQSHTVA